MRFFADGPWLPDELLVARDEGRVLFFCGAGVSRAYADLPDFLGLAQSVLGELRVLPESPAHKLLEAAGRLEPIEGVGGIVAADRIFGLLEREFSVADIERAVGAALKPKPEINLAAHRTLLALSRDATGKARLVTTNFDLLFEAAAPKLPVWTPNRLPNLADAEGFEGIVHLHGRFDPPYTKAVGGNLVLSSAEFGRAYLAEGWATDFIRAAIRRYFIVFVGYAADDPPVQYLLEALNRGADIPPRGLYAFQVGREEEVTALWAQRGVNAIAYSTENKHAALWETLNGWANRAHYPERWRERLIRRSVRGPQALAPHERGQVVHLAATEDGARSISQATRTLPATWLCVFDSAARYGQPGKAEPLNPASEDVDPFTDYKLDSDPPPTPPEENQAYRQRDVPPGVIDVLQPNPLDRETPSGPFRGYGPSHASRLSPRLASLAVWLHRVCGDPTALWWASGQSGLHPIVIRQIEFALNRTDATLPPVAQAGWRYLIEGWQVSSQTDDTAFALQTAIARDGWTAQHIRRFAAHKRARLKASRPFWGGPLPPRARKQLRIGDVLRLEVQYPERHVHFDIPDDQLFRVIPLLRQNLEYAIDLHREISPSSLPHIVPIERDPKLAGRSAEDEFGINRDVLEFAHLFRRLAQHDRLAAVSEVETWRQGNDPVFGRLRIWAAGLDNVLDALRAGEIFATADDGIFWGWRDQRDALISLSRRWASISMELRTTIERRILAGPPAQKGAAVAQNREWRALAILDRITWLRDQGCIFATDIKGVLAKAREAVPQWTPANATRAADSQEARGGTVTVDTSIDELADVPIAELIPRAMAGQRRFWGESRELDPFAGLSEHRPIRLIAALRYELAKGADVALPWTRFLHSAARLSDKPKVAALIARRLDGLPQPVLESIIMPVSYWLEHARKRLFERDPGAFWSVFDRLTDMVAENPAAAEGRSQAPGETRDWFNASEASVDGHLAAALFSDPALARLGPNDPLPQPWVGRAERLLSLPGDHGRFSLVHFARHLGWIHSHAAEWSEQYILAAMLGADANGDAALAGFFANPQVDGEQLYTILKPLLIELATREQAPERRDILALAALFVGGWLTRNDDGTRWLADDEFRRVLVYGGNDLRRQVLWQLGHFKDFGDKIAFLRDVWPRQVAVRTPIMVSLLCSIPFDDKAHLPELVDAVLPLVSHAQPGRLNFGLVGGQHGAIMKLYPDKVLDLLAEVLPDEVANWPYGVDQALQELIQAKPALATDPRMLRLKGIWNRR